MIREDGQDDIVKVTPAPQPSCDSRHSFTLVFKDLCGLALGLPWYPVAIAALGGHSVTRLTVARATRWLGFGFRRDPKHRVKQDDRRTYDFSTGLRRSQANCGRVSRLMLDGWDAYYRWLTELEKEAASAARTERLSRR